MKEMEEVQSLTTSEAWGLARKILGYRNPSYITAFANDIKWQT